jgi:hypothetical protein
MNRHVKAFTATFKIPSVLDGSCTQTIRPYGNKPVKVGDEILFHGWSGRPYRSPWSWRKRITVTAVTNIIISYHHGIRGLNHQIYSNWGEIATIVLAKLDGFDCPLSLRDWMEEAHNLSKKGERSFQVISWYQELIECRK